MYAYTLKSLAAGQTISTAITVLQLKAGAAAPIEILRMSLTQKGSTTSAEEKIAVVRKTAAATVTAAVAGTTLVKPRTNDPVAAASLGTAATGYTGTAEGTDGDELIHDGFNVLTGWLYLPIPEERIWIPGGGILALKFLTAPASQEWHASITFREYQG